jgi:hypothetical protein
MAQRTRIVPLEAVVLPMASVTLTVTRYRPGSSEPCSGTRTCPWRMLERPRAYVRLPRDTLTVALVALEEAPKVTVQEILGFLLSFLSSFTLQVTTASRP